MNVDRCRGRGLTCVVDDIVQLTKREWCRGAAPWCVVLADKLCGSENVEKVSEEGKLSCCCW